MKEIVKNLPIIDNIDKAEKEFAIALRRQSLMLFDNLGLHISVKDLPTHPIYEVCEELMNGSGRYFSLEGRASRFWCKRLRPLLMPKRQKFIERAYNAISLLEQQALLNSVIEQGKKIGLHNTETVRQNQ